MEKIVRARRGISGGLVVTAIVIAVLIIITGATVFGGLAPPVGPTPVVNLSQTNTASSFVSSSSSNSTATATTSSSVTQSSTETQASSSIPPVESAVVMLDFTPGAQDALFYEAKAQGYYAQDALSVGIQPGVGSAATIGAVAAGKVQFGLVDASTAVSSISAGAGVEILGAVTETQPYAIFYLSNQNVTSPKDLQGKTYCSSTADASHVMFPAFATEAGINPSDVKFLNVNPPYYTLLASGACQFTSDLLYSLGDYAAAVNQSGVAATVKYIPYSSYGINPYGYVLIANSQVIGTNADLVERFLNATYRGLQYVYDHQQAALSAVTSVIPGGSLSTQQTRFNVFLNASGPLFNSSLYVKNDPRSLGLVNPTLMNQTMGYAVKYLKAKAVPSSNLYTNNFLNCTPNQC